MSDSNDSGSAQRNQGITLIAFVTALNVSLIVFGVQTGFFLVLRNKLSRIFKPKTYLVPERERTEPPPSSPWGLVNALLRFPDREIIKKCGLDAYFFLRYLQTLLVIFVPMAVVIIPILVPVNYIGGVSRNFSSNQTETQGVNSSDPNGVDYSDPNDPKSNITGLDTLAWGNVRKDETNRYWAHLILAILVIIWVCGVFFSELRVYIKVRQDWLTTAEHRLRASATTVLVSGIPDKWLSEEALRGLFDVFPGGLRNVWLTRDLTHLLDKISKRDEIHKKLEDAQTELIRMAKKAQLKKREEDEKQARKASKSHRPTKEEKMERQKKEDTAAKMQAEGGQGVSSGDRHEVPHGINDAEAEVEADSRRDSVRPTTGHGILSTGISKLTGGLGKGVDAVGKTGQEIFGGAKNITHGIDNQIETTNGFVTIGPSQGPSSAPPSRGSDRRHVQLPDEKDLPRPSTQGSNHRGVTSEDRVMGTPAGRALHSHNNSTVSQDTMLKKESVELRWLGNTTRKATTLEDTQAYETVRWWQFWKPPEGAYASPLPQGYEGDDFPFKKKEKTFWEKVKSAIPFVGGEELEPIEYPKAFDEDWKDDHDTGAEWEKWVKKSKRPTHRLPIFDWTPSWLPGLPLLNKKVDTIYWCRQELARLNLEIETDQKNPERYPLMKSAFIQFNHQVAAHMACQSVTHHVPKHMAPRTVEISPDDVLWENMAMSWWSEWLRTTVAVAVVVGMIILWAFPVAFTSSISQVSTLTDNFPWLDFINKNDTIHNIVSGVAGVLPAILLALLLWLVPIIMGFLAGFKGAKTGSQKSETVQKFYFAFLFVQVFLVVSLATGLLQTLEDIANNPTGIADILAENLPKAADYFFSYMILQALSVSSGTLLQIGALIKWYIISKIFNNTARNKWSTNTKLPEVNWGTTFPVYTNFACIGLIYSVVAPIISIFAIITFSLLWIANRYSMLYVNRFRMDTGGVLYPQAINQTFTGLYVMELCLVGLFFLVRDENDKVACAPQAIIMIVAIVLTGIYQLLLNQSFGPLFRYLPITFEDEAVLRDEAFQRAQDRRLGLVEEGDEDEAFDKDGVPNSHHRDGDISTSMDGVDDKTGRGNKFTNFKPVKGIVHAGTWAARGGKTTYDRTFGKAEKGLKNVNKFREERRQKDLEAQRAIGEALYGGFHDEIEDLTPEERDVLVKRAFVHSALRARRPTVWIPRDDLGVSDDEIRRTREFSDHIWISNEGTALDSKVRVVYGRAPPDFSELDIISL